MVADSAPSRKRNIPKSFVRKSSTVEQWASKKQPYATGWHCALPQFRHTAPPGGAFILGRQKGKVCCRATSTGIWTWCLWIKILDVHPCAYRPESWWYSTMEISIVYLKFYRSTWGISIGISRILPTPFESPMIWLIADLFLSTILIIFAFHSITSSTLSTIHWNNIYPTLTHSILLLSVSIGATQYFQRVLVLVS